MIANQPYSFLTTGNGDILISLFIEKAKWDFLLQVGTFALWAIVPIILFWCARFIRVIIKPQMGLDFTPTPFLIDAYCFGLVSGGVFMVGKSFF